MSGRNSLEVISPLERIVRATIRTVALGRVFAAALALLVSVLPMPAAAQSDPAARALFESNENYAVVVGVDRYRYANPLNYAVADATRLAGLLEAQGYEVELIVDYEADPDAIVERLRTVGEIITRDGRERRGNLLFAFSGHGFRQGQENYLATGRTDPERLVETALPMSALKDVLLESGVRQRALFIDACRNDPSRSRGHDNGTFTLDEDAEGLAILYSTGAGTLSWEDPDLGQGVFSYFLSEGLSGEAADEAGYVTFDGLYRYVQTAVKNYVLSEFDRKQIPYVGGERTGTFVLGRPGPFPPGGSRPSPVEGAGTEERPRRRGWAIAGGVLGAVVLGVLAASAGGSESNEPASLTLVVPTP